jgi:hypothetical protein
LVGSDLIFVIFLLNINIIKTQQNNKFYVTYNISKFNITKWKLSIIFEIYEIVKNRLN